VFEIVPTECCSLNWTGISGLWFNHSSCINELRSSWDSFCISWNGGRSQSLLLFHVLYVVLLYAFLLDHFFNFFFKKICFPPKKITCNLFYYCFVRYGLTMGSLMSLFNIKEVKFRKTEFQVKYFLAMIFHFDVRIMLKYWPWSIVKHEKVC
jgi:hypothetical protein